MANTYWVNVARLGMGGTGTFLDPFGSLAECNSAVTLGVGDVVNCWSSAGPNIPIRGQVQWTGNLSGVTIQQIPSLPTYEQRNSVAISGFTGPVAGVYTKTLTASLLIRGVSWNYGVTTTTVGSRTGFLTRAASAVAVVSSGNYFYDSTTGVLTIHVGADPATGTVEYGLRSADNIAVLQFNQLDETAVIGLTIAYGLKNPGESGQYGNLIAATTCTNTTWSGLFLYDGGNHCTLMSGGVLSGNLVTACTYWGINDGGIMHVFFSTAGSSGANELDDCSMFLHGPLNFDGNANANTPTNTFGTVYSHTGGGGATITNLTYRRNTFTFVNASLGEGPACDFTVDPTTPEDYTTWSNKAIDCLIVGGVSSTHGDSGMAHVNCNYDYSASGTAGYAIFFKDGYHGYFGCTITSNTASNIFQLGFNNAANHVYFIACTIINRTASNANHQYIFFGAFQVQPVNLIARKCLFAYSRATSGGAKDLLLDGGGLLVFTAENNAYYGLDSTTGDGTATAISTNPFTAISTSGDLTGAGRKIRHTGAIPAGALRGINHKRYARNYGSWQYPNVLASRRNDPRLAGRRQGGGQK